MKYAVFSTSGKQYLVSEGQELLVDKVDSNEKGPVEFDKVLLTVDDKKVKVGEPFLGSKIKAVVTDQIKSKKVRVFKYKAKTGYHKTQGHRQQLTKIKIEKIEV